MKKQLTIVMDVETVVAQIFGFKRFTWGMFKFLLGFLPYGCRFSDCSLRHCWDLFWDIWCLFSEKSICEAEDFEKVSICSPGNISEVLKWFYVIYICFVSKGIFTQHSSYALWLFIYSTTKGLGAWKHQLLKTEVRVFEKDAIILSICKL